MEPTKFDMKYASIRQAIIEQRFEKLNARQREAVFQTDGPCSSLRARAAEKLPYSSTASSICCASDRALPTRLPRNGQRMSDLLFLAEYLNDPKPEKPGAGRAPVRGASGKAWR